MKKLRRILSAALIVALLLSVLVPATPVNAGSGNFYPGASADDCEVHWTGAAWVMEALTSGHSPAGYNSGVLARNGNGERFLNVTVPQGATIDVAYLTYTCSYGDPAGTVVNTRITGEDVDDAAVFSNIADYQARRGTIVGGANNDYITTAQVDWDGLPQWSIGTPYQSPSIVSIIQEIVNRGGFESGNDVVLWWDDHDNRSTAAAGAVRFAASWDNPTYDEPVLHIEWSTPPSVTTSAATLVEETTATLNANLTDLAGHSPVYAYFQYGLTTGYGTNTSEQTKTGTGTYLQAIADLSPGTTYHFRAAVRYDSNYVYGDDATFNTKPLPPTGVGATTGETSVTLAWTKGAGADKTTIRRSTTAFPATPASGDSVYGGTGATVFDDTLVTNQLYYYSLWSKSTADVYSDTYVTISATPSGDVLSPPDVLQIIDVKVFSSYDEYEDQLYVIRYKIIYNAGDPIQDCADYFNFELLDGATLKAQVTVESWGYKPGSIYLATLGAPDWGGTYTVKLRGSDATWGDPPVTQWNLTSGDWVGADLTQLDTWVITVAESMQTYYAPTMPVGWSMVIFAPTGTVLSVYGGPIFNEGILGLSIKRPHIFSTAAEFPGAEPTEHDTTYVETEMTMTNLGPYISGLIEEGADWVNMETEMLGGFVFGGGYLFIAIVIAFIGAGILIGMAVASPILIMGVWFGLIPPSFLMVIAFIFAFFVIKAIWLRGT